MLKKLARYQLFANGLTCSRKDFPMKNVLFLLSAVTLLACNNSGSDADKSSTAATDSRLLNKDSVFAQDLREFRDAIYQSNRSKAKSYFRFPVINTNNEIWFVADQDSLIGTLNGDEIVAFTSKDFDKYYNRLFPKEFIQGLLRIKVNELVRTGEFSHDFEMKESDIIYSLTATRHEKDSLFTLSLGYREEIEPGQDEEPVISESSYIYNFRILEDGHFVFKEIRIAG
jgi:hypothetical protein